MTIPISPTTHRPLSPDAPAADGRSTRRRVKSAMTLTISTIATVAALGGIEHGIGEVLQGNVAPAAIAFTSWPDVEAFQVLGGEPAMTVVPNLLATGILAILSSLVFLAWAILFARRRHGGLVMILLSIVMLLFGGGFGPPLVGIVLGIAAIRTNALLASARTERSGGTRRVLAALWPWAFGIDVVAWLLLLPGSVLIAYVFGVNAVPSALLYALIASVFGFLILALVTGFAYDSRWPADTTRLPS